jgi:methyltransferase (TIGR00027 family)
MKKGQASKTAEYVCQGRALAHGVVLPERFDDPTALVLLSEEARREVERTKSLPPPSGLRARFRYGYLQAQAAMMAARTVTIDDVIRQARNPQLVILGAGLDGRAWRLNELRDVSVFEVDHPDSQREKRERSSKLRPISCDLRFVPVDFEHDALDRALASAGHDESRPTTWLWEGVVMYLARRDIEASLSVMQRRSVPGSRLVLVYHAPALLLKAVNLYLKRVGEPLRSALRPEHMRELLASYDFEVTSDVDLPSAGRALSQQLGTKLARLKHIRIATAQRRATRLPPST